MSDAWSLFFSLMFGVIGMAYFAYGKRNANVVVLICGIALIIFPYAVDSTYALFGIGLALMMVPKFLKIS